MTLSPRESSYPHAFEPPMPGASRSPCPALNALASHGYLPHSGRNISFSGLLHALRSVYCLSLPLALLLALPAFLFCGRGGFPSLPFLGTIDLHDLARHNRIEHDASLAHADAEPGAISAPTKPDKTLLTELLKEGKEILSLKDISWTRAQRNHELALKGRGLSSLHAEITRGEISLLISVIGDGEKVSTEKLRQWMGEERLPDGWFPRKTQGLIETVRQTRKVKAMVYEAMMNQVSSRNAKE